MTGQIVEGRDQTQGLDVETDFCVVGSGAGGGACAMKLAETGFEVAILEEGPNIPKGKATAARATCGRRYESASSSCTASSTRRVRAASRPTADFR